MTALEELHEAVKEEKKGARACAGVGMNEGKKVPDLVNGRDKKWRALHLITRCATPNEDGRSGDRGNRQGQQGGRRDRPMEEKGGQVVYLM